MSHSQKRPYLTNPFLLEPLASSLWLLMAGILCVAIELRAMLVDMLPTAAGMAMILVAAHRFRQEYPGTQLAAASQIVMFAAAIGILVELPRTFGFMYGAWLAAPYDIFVGSFWGLLGVLAWSIGTECRTHGFDGTAFAWRSVGLCIALLIAAPWALFGALDLMGAIRPGSVLEELDDFLYITSRILVLMSLAPLGLLWYQTHRASTSSPVARSNPFPTGGHTCSRCGYDKRGLPSEVCPECGTRTSI